MIQETIQTLIDEFSKKWAVQPGELAFLVANYNPTKERQNGEAELKRTSDYSVYSAHTDHPVRKLSYWKEVKKACTKMIHEDVLPLRKR